MPIPCIWLAHGKFELTNQDSAGRKKSSGLKSSKQVRKGFEIRQLFSLKMALKGPSQPPPFSMPSKLLILHSEAKSECFTVSCVPESMFNYLL